MDDKLYNLLIWCLIIVVVFSLIGVLLFILMMKLFDYSLRDTSLYITTLSVTSED